MAWFFQLKIAAQRLQIDIWMELGRDWVEWNLLTLHTDNRSLSTGTNRAHSLKQQLIPLHPLLYVGTLGFHMHIFPAIPIAVLKFGVMQYTWWRQLQLAGDFSLSPPRVVPHFFHPLLRHKATKKCHSTYQVSHLQIAFLKYVQEEQSEKLSHISSAFLNIWALNYFIRK